MRMRFVLLLLSIPALAGCVFISKVHYRTADGVRMDASPTVEDSDLVGLALSGGGSRAALFAASGMEALWEHGVLKDIDYISSVSGGSIASAYFVKKTAIDGEVPDAAFFERFRAQMRHRFGRATLRRQCRKARWLSPTRRATSFGEVLDKRFLEGTTLGEIAGVRPQPLFNTALYDNGRRLVMTTLRQEEFDLDSGEGTAGKLSEHPALKAMTFDHEAVMEYVPADFPLSLAVASSAAVPLVLGPVTIETDSRYWHLGDGGLFDNSGVETLQQVFLRKLQATDMPAQARIFSLDSGVSSSEVVDDLTRIKNFWIARNPETVTDIPMARSRAYHALAWSRIREELGAAAPELIVMKHTLVEVKPELLPASCAHVRTLQQVDGLAGAIRHHIRQVPTKLSIAPCDADLIELAAHIAVHRQLTGRFERKRACRLEATPPVCSTLQRPKK